jgi:hypothetical protein
MKAIRCVGRLMGGLMSLRSGSAKLLLALLLFPAAASAQSFDVSSESLTVTVKCSPTEVKLTDIKGKTGRKDFDYLNGTPSLLSFGLNNSDPANYYNGTFTNVMCNLSSGVLNITANSSDGLLAFWIGVAPDGANPVVIVSTQVTYQGPSTGTAAPTVFFRAQLPSVQFNIPNSAMLPGNAMAMVPQMVGTVVPLANVNSGGLGATYASDGTNVPPSTFGLPTNLNVMEIAEVYDGGGGGGLYFMDLSGDYANNIAPLQFNLTGTNTTYGTVVYQITGYWTALLKLSQPGFNQWVTLPSLAIGTHSSGDWHHAVDYYVAKRSPNWTFPNTPSWFREAAGIYLLGVAGGGSFFATFPFTAINDSYFGIELFACNSTIKVNGTTKTTGTPPNLPGHRCLLDVYNDAQKLGANVLYLTSWWSGGYGNKGDYIVDPNLGGETGLTEAVTEIHSLPNRGYVILYMEPYATADSSALVSTGPGNTWQAQPEPPISPSLKPADICPGAKGDCMAMPNTQWQDYLINIVSISDPTETNAINLIKTTGVDGVFLDSWGWQMNWPAGTSSEDVDYTSKEWTAAALRFVDRFRAAIQLGNPNAIVMGENNTGQLPFHWDGGSAADLTPWGPTFKEDTGMLLASPIRYAMPNANFFVNGKNLAGLNQVFAAGHNLALGSFWLTDVIDAQSFAAYGAYGIAAFTTLTTTMGSNSASLPSSTSPDLTTGLSISATSVPNGTTVEAISGTTVTLSQNATTSASVPGGVFVAATATHRDHDADHREGLELGLRLGVDRSQRWSVHLGDLRPVRHDHRGDQRHERHAFSECEHSGFGPGGVFEEADTATRSDHDADHHEGLELRLGSVVGVDRPQLWPVRLGYVRTQRHDHHGDQRHDRHAFSECERIGFGPGAVFLGTTATELGRIRLHKLSDEHPPKVRRCARLWNPAPYACNDFVRYRGVHVSRPNQPARDHRKQRKRDGIVG